MAGGGSITSVVPRVVIAVAVDAGARAEPLFRAAGLAPDVAPAADVHIPADRYIALWDLVIAAVGDRAFGLRVAAELRIEDNEVFGFLAMSCATLGEAFDRTAKYRELYNTGARWELQIDADAERVIHYPWPSSARSPGRRAAVELAVADMASAARQLSAGGAAAPIEVRFAHDAPRDLRPYRAAFGVDPVFNASLDELVFARGMTAIAVATFNSRLREYFDVQCQQLAAKFTADAPITARARTALIAAMGGGDPSMDGVARTLGMSARSLHRRLSDEGARFNDLLDDVRQEFAKRYLARRSVTASEVAYLVGFQSPTAFFRAFKRWTGQTPKSFLAAPA
jgi:AraC-like DNA-binding protein